jgi:23S rRNA (uracil1939-C5)-methyltransferase
MPRKKKFTLEAVLIEKYAAEGKCLAKVDEKVVFVQGAVPGDVVDIFVTKNKKDYAEGRVSKFLSYSPHRIEAKCHHFKNDSCGGCKWQMIPYSSQLQYKQEQVYDMLTRIGKVKGAEFLPIAGADSIYEYRNKLEFTFSNKKYLSSDQLNQEEISPYQNVLGFHAPSLFDKVIDITSCHLMPGFQNELRNGIRDFALKHRLTFYDHRTHTGLLRNLMVRMSSIGEILVNIVFSENTDDARVLVDWIVSSYPQITSMHYTINPKLNDTLYDLEIACIKGPGFIRERLEDFEFVISPKSFFQTNTAQGSKLYQITREMAEFTGSEILYDFYCGTGSIGIFCSKQVAKVIGVESIPDAIEDAKINASHNHVVNSEWYAGDVIKIVNEDFFKKHGHPDVIICDPPRAGMHGDLIEKLLQIQALKIVYVSCNPATQARDLALLQECYDVLKVQAVDMFPHTHHVESVALLELRKAEA